MDTKNKLAASSGRMSRLVRRLRLVARRMLFVALILPVGLLHTSVWLLIIMCEIGWVILGYVSGRTEHEWLEWTERLIDWMQEFGDRVTALNSPPNVKGVARREEGGQSEAKEGRCPPLPLPSCSISSLSLAEKLVGLEELFARGGPDCLDCIDWDAVNESLASSMCKVRITDGVVNRHSTSDNVGSNA